MIYTLTLNPAVDRELTVPAVEYDAVLRATASRVDLGGKGFNVSRMLKSLGTASTAVGFVGGRSGELLQDGLRGLEIATEFVWVPGETRTNISIVTEDHDHYIKVNEKGPEVSRAKQDELLAKIESISQAGDWWVLSGSPPPGVEDGFYAQIIRLLNQKQSKAVLDTSSEPLRLGCAKRPFLVKPNLEETRALTQKPLNNLSEITAAAREIIAMGAQNAVISMGKAGAVAQTQEGKSWLVGTPKVQQKNPIGAGDSMVGGLVWALTRGFTLRDSLAWGVASGAATASQSGTGMGSRALIEELHAQVSFTEV